MTEMHTANDVSPPILHLAESGDVILQLGRNKGPQSSMSLLVSSAKLRAASPVFAVMFDGRFMEGQGLTPAAPRVVPLPDDNLQHILSICKAVHGTDVGTCYCNGFDDLVDFATTADKYDCAAAIFELSRTFVLRRMAAPEHPFFAKMLFVTFVLDLPQEFNTVVREMILADKPVNIQTAMCGRDILRLSIFSSLHNIHVLGAKP